MKFWKGALVAAVLSSAFSAQAAQSGRFYTDGSKNRKAIALSFDDGPGHEYTVKVLDLLDQNQVKATFFMNGDQVQIRPEIAREVAKRGHEIGDHTWSHLNFYAYEKKNGAEKAKEKVRDEMKKSRDILVKTLGKAPAVCRMPNGYNRPWLGAIAKEFDYALVNWTFGEDWLNLSGEKMAQDYVKHVRPGSILLFHDGGVKREKTLQAVSAVIAEARRQGLEIVTVGGMLAE
jgi:peptidoglycan/xylan/chitin deacetylase (PgdA/CDA1 family)